MPPRYIIAHPLPHSPVLFDQSAWLLHFLQERLNLPRMWPEPEVELFYYLAPIKTKTDYVKMLRVLMSSSNLLKNKQHKAKELNATKNVILSLNWRKTKMNTKTSDSKIPQ